MDLPLAVVLAGVAGATVGDLTTLRPDRLLPRLRPVAEPTASVAPWQPYALLPADLAPGEDTTRVDRTVAALLAAHPNLQVVVIDRGDPGPVTARSDRVAVVHVDGPEDVTNTAAFLNAGLDVVLHDVQRRGLDPQHVLLVPVDLDTRLPGAAVDAAVAVLADPAVPGVQLPVRPLPRAVADLDGAGLTAWAAATVHRSRPPWPGDPRQPAQGQLLRLSALLDVDDRPWWTTVADHQVDLVLSLLVDGRELPLLDEPLVSVPPAHRLREVAGDRTRTVHAWLGSTARLGELWRSKELANRTLLRTTGRILRAWALPPVALLLLHGLVQLALAVPRDDLGHLGLSATALVAYLAGRLVVLVAAVLMARRLRLDQGTEPAIALGCTLASPITVVATLRALGRIVFRLGNLVGVDEFQVRGVSLAVARKVPRLPPIPEGEPGPVRLRARLHEGPRPSPRRRR